MMKKHTPEHDHIDAEDEYARCAWARYFNTSEHRLKEAIAAVGNQAGRVRDHLAGKRVSERPSAG
jgi:hypothetical protein